MNYWKVIPMWFFFPEVFLLDESIEEEMEICWRKTWEIRRMRKNIRSDKFLESDLYGEPTGIFLQNDRTFSVDQHFII